MQSHILSGNHLSVFNAKKLSFLPYKIYKYIHEIVSIKMAKLYVGNTDTSVLTLTSNVI